MNAFLANVESWPGDDADDWVQRGARELTPQTLQQLLDNSIPSIRLNLVSEAACDALANRLMELTFGQYQDVEPKIDRIGCTVFEHDSGGTQLYFTASEMAAEERDRVFAQTFDPLRMVVRELSQRTGRRASIAQDSSGRTYYAGLIRRIELGTELHIDFAPSEHSGWSVCDVRNQLSWNLYVKIGRHGSGRTTIFRRQWQPHDERLREGSYGFSRTAVAGSDYVTVQPRVGEVVFFNTRNYHIVDPSCGARVTIGSAIGETPSGDLILWS